MSHDIGNWPDVWPRGPLPPPGSHRWPLAQRCITKFGAVKYGAQSVTYLFEINLCCPQSKRIRSKPFCSSVQSRRNVKCVHYCVSLRIQNSAQPSVARILALYLGAGPTMSPCTDHFNGPFITAGKQNNQRGECSITMLIEALTVSHCHNWKQTSSE